MKLTQAVARRRRFRYIYISISISIYIYIYINIYLPRPSRRSASPSISVQSGLSSMMRAGAYLGLISSPMMLVRIGSGSSFGPSLPVS